MKNDRGILWKIPIFLLCTSLFLLFSCGQTSQIVPNRPPVPDAGPDFTVYQGQRFRLTGSGSSDPDGRIVSYRWHQTGGRRAEVSDYSSANPDCIAPFIRHPVEELVFTLTVTDEKGSSANDTVKIHVIKYLFFDDFSTDTIREYGIGDGRPQENTGKIQYYYQLKQILVVPGESNRNSFSHTLPASDNAMFSFMFSASRIDPPGGRIRAVLMEDASNFYEVSIGSEAGSGFLRKVARGREVDRVEITKGYSLNDQNMVRIVFNRKSTIVDVFNQIAMLNRNGESITVQRFELLTEGQDTFFGQIALTQDPFVKIAIPNRIGLWDSTLIVRATVANLPSGAWVRFMLDKDTNAQYTEDGFQEPFESTFRGVTLSKHMVNTFIIDHFGTEVLAADQRTYTAKDGYYVAMGDSITKGTGSIGRQYYKKALKQDIFAVGYEPILESLLESAKGYPHSVVNEGVGGDTSADGLLLISSLLAKHPQSNYFLIMYGTNDSEILIPSGKGLKPGDPGYRNSYKENMQKMISLVLSAGKTPFLAKVPIVWGIEGRKSHFRNPDRNSRNIRIKEYNVVIDELIQENGIPVPPPDFYAYFRSHLNEYSDNVHPNSRGYQSMAELWFRELVPRGMNTQHYKKN